MLEVDTVIRVYNGRSMKDNTLKLSEPTDHKILVRHKTFLCYFVFHPPSAQKSGGHCE